MTFNMTNKADYSVVCRFHLFGRVMTNDCIHAFGLSDFLYKDVNDCEDINDLVVTAPNDTAYKRWSCHSGLKLLCKLC